MTEGHKREALVIVNTGDGKSKTTAALGALLRGRWFRIPARLVKQAEPGVRAPGSDRWKW